MAAPFGTPLVNASAESPDSVEPVREQQTAASAAVAVCAEPVASCAAEEPQLDANKLHCYKVALELHALCCTLVSPLSRITRDQLERASLSVVLNTAEAMVPHYLLEETTCEKRRSCAPQLADATSILSPGRLPFVTWT